MKLLTRISASCLLFLAVNHLCVPRAGAQSTILFTGKLDGYPVNLPTRTDSSSILIGMGDNLSFDYLSRFDMSGNPVSRTSATPSNRMITFLKNAKYDALVPGAEDFDFGAAFLHRAADSKAGLPISGLQHRRVPAARFARTASIARSGPGSFANTGVATQLRLQWRRWQRQVRRIFERLLRRWRTRLERCISWMPSIQCPRFRQACVSFGGIHLPLDHYTGDLSTAGYGYRPGLGGHSAGTEARQAGELRKKKAREIPSPIYRHF